MLLYRCLCKYLTYQMDSYLDTLVLTVWKIYMPTENDK